MRKRVLSIAGVMMLCLGTCSAGVFAEAVSYTHLDVYKRQGRIKHHLKHNLWREECTILFVGYQAIGTLGRAIAEGTDKVKLFGEEIEIYAEIAQLTGISGHADNEGLIRWISALEKKPKRVFIIHGEDRVAEGFAERLRKEKGLNAYAPFSGTIFDLATAEFIKEAQPVKIDKTKNMSPATLKANTVFARLLAAGQRLLTVIWHNEQDVYKRQTLLSMRIMKK